MQVFLSHNSADKDTARALAMLLAGEGVNLFFDEWNIRLGEPLMGKIQQGVAGSDVFILMWSAAAQRSNWVDAELLAFLRRRIDNQQLRVVPLMLDATPLPAMVADFRGLDISVGNAAGNNIETVTRLLVGEDQRDIQLAQRLQQRLNELSQANLPDDPFGWLVCPSCASENLKRTSATDYAHDDTYYIIECEDCGNGDWTQ